METFEDLVFFSMKVTRGSFGNSGMLSVWISIRYSVKISVVDQ